MTAPAAFKQSDLVRAARAMKRADVPIARIEIEPGGRIVIVAGEPAPADPSAFNPWDEVLGCSAASFRVSDVNIAGRPR